MVLILAAIAVGLVSLSIHSTIGLVFAGISLVAAIVRWIAKAH